MWGPKEGIEHACPFFHPVGNHGTIPSYQFHFSMYICLYVRVTHMCLRKNTNVRSASRNRKHMKQTRK